MGEPFGSDQPFGSDGSTESDEPTVWCEVEVPAVGAPAVVDLVLLFADLVEDLLLTRRDVLVVRAAATTTTIRVPEYLVESAVDVGALAARATPGPLRPEEVSSALLDLAGLLTEMLPSREGGAPELEALFAARGLPIDARSP